MNHNEINAQKTLPFLGQRYLLTGASRGLGKLTLETLVKLGAQVIAVARNKDQLSALAEAYPSQVIPCSLDLSEPQKVTDWAHQIWENFGQIHGIIHNAGVDDFSSILELSSEAITRQVNLNLIAPILINRALLPHLLEQEAGVIIHMSSVAGLVPVPFGSVYSATKAGLSMYVEALASELYQTPIRFVTLHPGFVHGVGMHEAHKALVGRAPFTLGGTTDQKVVKAVIHELNSTQSGLVSRVISQVPTRPFGALYLLLPRLARWLSKQLMFPYLSRIAKARNSSTADSTKIERP